MFYVYILKSKTIDRYYIGCTSRLIRRLKYHNKGRNRSTKGGIPWEIVCYRRFKQQKEAYEEEKRIKSYKGGVAFKNIINGEVAEWLKATVC